MRKYIENNSDSEGEALLALQYLMHRLIIIIIINISCTGSLFYYYYAQVHSCFHLMTDLIRFIFFRLEHPNKLLHSIFEILYDDDIIGDDALLSWETNSDPAKQVCSRSL